MMPLWSPWRQRSSLLGLRVLEALNPVDSPNVLVTAVEDSGNRRPESEQRKT